MRAVISTGDAIVKAERIEVGATPFWIGFCLGIIGVIIYLVQDNETPVGKAKVQKALKGMLISLGCVILAFTMCVCVGIVSMGAALS